MTGGVHQNRKVAHQGVVHFVFLSLQGGGVGGIEMLGVRPFFLGGGGH